MHLTPHMLRHGGPGEDVLGRRRALPEVQERGRWAARASAKNYAKGGRVLRQLRGLSDAQRRRGARLLHAIPSLLLLR